MRSRPAPGRRRLALAVSGVLAAGAAGLLAFALLAPRPAVEPPRTFGVAGEAAVESAPTPESTPDPEPEPVEPVEPVEPAPVATMSASEEKSAADEPSPAALGTPARVVIPAIDVDATLVSVGLLADGAMEVPDFGLAGWYELGPKPGEPGPAVVVAHVDSRAGPDVFHRLHELDPGDEVEIIDEDGKTARFAVSGSELTKKDELPVDRIWNDTEEPVIRLITCGGEFDRERRSYRSNTIVYAEQA